LPIISTTGNKKATENYVLCVGILIGSEPQVCRFKKKNTKNRILLFN